MVMGGVVQNPPSARAARKSTSHRKRHVPVGPAGVWFQTQAAPHHSKKEPNKGRGGGGGGGEKVQGRTETTDENDEFVLADGSTAPPRRSQQRSSESNNGNGSGGGGGGGLSLCSSAWMCMQIDLNVVLPSLPASLSESDRCSALRRCLPPEYKLLSDILCSTHTEWKLRHCKLVVLVQTIQSLTDNLWTVKVTDESNACITGWVQPNLVRNEQQRPVPAYIRPGLVWLLVNPTIILHQTHPPHSNNHNSSDHHRSNGAGAAAAASGGQPQRILLISESTIDRVWTPFQAKEISDDSFVKWLEQRNLVTSSALETLEVQQQPQPQQQSYLNRDEEIELEETVPNDDDDDDDDEEEHTFEGSQMPMLRHQDCPEITDCETVEIPTTSFARPYQRQRPAFTVSASVVEPSMTSTHPLMMPVSGKPRETTENHTEANIGGQLCRPSPADTRRSVRTATVAPSGSLDRAINSDALTYSQFLSPTTKPSSLLQERHNLDRQRRSLSPNHNVQDEDETKPARYSSQPNNHKSTSRTAKRKSANNKKHYDRLSQVPLTASNAIRDKGSTNVFTSSKKNKIKTPSALWETSKIDMGLLEMFEDDDEVVDENNRELPSNDTIAGTGTLALEVNETTPEPNNCTVQTAVSSIFQQATECECDTTHFHGLFSEDENDGGDGDD